MGSTNEKRAAHSIVEREGMPYTMALRLLREAKEKEPDRSWAALAKDIRENSGVTHTHDDHPFSPIDIETGKPIIE